MPINIVLDLDRLSDAELKAERTRLVDERIVLGDSYADGYGKAMARYGSHQNIPASIRRDLNAIQVDQFALDKDREIVDTCLNRSGFVGGVGGIPTYPVVPDVAVSPNDAEPPKPRTFSTKKK